MGAGVALSLSACATDSFFGNVQAEQMPDRPWLDVLNDYRAESGLPPVVHDPQFDEAARLHSCYMLLNGIGHDELPDRPGYTPEGDHAGNSSNVAVSSEQSYTDELHIDLWMTGPFHAIGILRPALNSVSYGTCDAADTPTDWRSAATLNVLDGFGGDNLAFRPVVFPGDGARTHLNKFIAETPNPIEQCGWKGEAGLPLIALMPNEVNNPHATVTDNEGKELETCVLYAGNVTEPSAHELLYVDNAVVILPRMLLADSEYHVTLTTDADVADWRFTVDSRDD